MAEADRCAGNGSRARPYGRGRPQSSSSRWKQKEECEFQERKSTRNVKIIETGILGWKQHAFGWNVSVQRDWHE